MPSEVFTASTSWVVPEGVTSVVVECWGAGGGGGGAGLLDPGRGGGGGGYSKETALAVTPGASHTVTVGTGGAGNTGTAAGDTGGDSWFSSAATVLAKGGTGGGGNGGAVGAGGAAASGVGDTKFSGGNGGAAGGGDGGGGGGGAGDAANGDAGSGSAAGAGGATGGGAGGVGGDNIGIPPDGTAGNVRGGGGGGGAAANGDGAAGARGEVKVTYTQVFLRATTGPVAAAVGGCASRVAGRPHTTNTSPVGVLSPRAGSSIVARTRGGPVSGLTLAGLRVTDRIDRAGLVALLLLGEQAPTRFQARPHTTHVSPTGARRVGIREPADLHVHFLAVGGQISALAPAAAHHAAFPRSAGVVSDSQVVGQELAKALWRKTAGPISALLLAPDDLDAQVRPLLTHRGPTGLLVCRAELLRADFRGFTAHASPTSDLLLRDKAVRWTIRTHTDHAGPTSQSAVALAKHVIFVRTDGGIISGLWAGSNTSAYQTRFQGVTRDADGNALGGVTVWLYRANGTSDRGFVQETTSDASGNYTVSDLSTSGDHFVYSFKDDSPHIFGASDHTLQVELAQIFP